MEKELDKMLTTMPLFKDNMAFLREVVKYISTRIETENPAVLRSQISDAYSYMAFLTRLKSRAEATYRLAQKQAAQTTSKEFKAHAREGIINGETAQYRFARDLLEGYLDTLNSKLSASKAILLSIDNELKRMPNE